MKFRKGQLVRLRKDISNNLGNELGLNPQEDYKIQRTSTPNRKCEDYQVLTIINKYDRKTIYDAFWFERII